MKTFRSFFSSAALALLMAAVLPAQVPQIIHYQSRVAVSGVNFEGSGQFKFALVNTDGSTTYWSNDGTSTAGSEPAAAVTLPVAKGLYAVHLGDTALANMAAIPASVFTHADVRLRVWFNDGVNGSQMLAPDHRIAAVGYAMMAGTLQPGADINAGTVTATTFSGSGAGLSGVAGALPWVVVSGTTQQAAVNTGYLAANAAEVTVTLPSSPAVGDIVRVSGAGAGGWKIIQNNGQAILASSLASPPGLVWTPREVSRNWGSVASSSDGNKLVAAVTNGQLYTSTDSGATWTARETARNWRSVASSSDGTKLVAAVDGGQIYTSADSGTTWIARDSSRSWESVASSSDGTTLVAVVTSGQIYTSTNAGASWTPRDINRTWMAVASSADGTKLVAAAQQGALYTSTDSGITWIPRDVTATWLEVASSSDGTRLVAAAINSQLYTSSDSGVTWTARESVRNWQSVASSSDGTKLLAGVYNGQIFSSTDSGVTWTARDTVRGWTGLATSADGDKWVAVASSQQIYTVGPSAGPFSTTITSGYLRGRQFTALELQYIGNGQFFPLSSTGTIIAY